MNDSPIRKWRDEDGDPTKTYLCNGCFLTQQSQGEAQERAEQAEIWLRLGNQLLICNLCPKGITDQGRQCRACLEGAYVTDLVNIDETIQWIINNQK